MSAFGWFTRQRPPVVPSQPTHYLLTSKRNPNHKLYVPFPYADAIEVAEPGISTLEEAYMRGRSTYLGRRRYFKLRSYEYNLSPRSDTFAVDKISSTMYGPNEPLPPYDSDNYAAISRAMNRRERRAMNRREGDETPQIVNENNPNENPRPVIQAERQPRSNNSGNVPEDPATVGGRRRTRRAKVVRRKSRRSAQRRKTQRRPRKN